MIKFITIVLVSFQLLIGQIATELLNSELQSSHQLSIELEPCFSIFDEDHEEGKDDWTDGLAVHIAHLSTGEKLTILCETPNDAWEKLEAWLWNKNDYTTSILSVIRDEW